MGIYQAPTQQGSTAVFSFIRAPCLLRCFLGYKNLDGTYKSTAAVSMIARCGNETYRISVSPILSPSRQAHRLTRREAALFVTYFGLPQLALARIVTSIHTLHPEDRKNTPFCASLLQHAVIAETIRLYACCSLFSSGCFPKAISTNLDPLTLDPFFPRGPNSKLVAA